MLEAAQRAGVSHFVYSTMSGLRPDTGVGHFESKWQVEQRVKASGAPFTIVRPAAFMEFLAEPHFGLGEGRFTFFMKPGGTMQLIAVADIGDAVARVFAEPARHLGTTLDLAGDTLSGEQIAAQLGRALGRPIEYRQFPPEVLEASPLLRRLTELVEEGVAVGDADPATLRQLVPGLLSFEAWLAQSGAAELRARY